MEPLNRLARAGVGRALGFSCLGIFTVTASLAHIPLLATRVAAMMMSLLTIALLLQALGAMRRDYRLTEIGMMLPQAYQPPRNYAQWTAATILRDTYMWFAQIAAAVTAMTWAMALMLSLLY